MANILASRQPILAFLAAAGLLPLLASGCSKSLVCGEGSLEVDGECVSMATLPGATSCGAGTRYNEVSGQCEAEVIADGFGECGTNTARVVGDDGIPRCEGSGGCTADCSVPPICPSPTGSNITVCGRVYDLATTDPVSNDATDTSIVSRLSGKLYDPIAFINDPNTATVLREIDFDGCGYWQAENVPLPFSGKIGIAIDDADDSPDDMYVRTGVAVEADPGDTVNLITFVASRATDMSWTTMAGNPVGSETFFEDGVYVPIYIDTNAPAVGPFEGTPKAGVVVSRGTSTSPNNDFYFSDTAPGGRTTIDVGQDVTGANGTALLYGFPGIDNNYTGIGPAGCTWPVDQGGMVDDAIFVQVRNGQCN